MVITPLVVPDWENCLNEIFRNTADCQVMNTQFLCNQPFLLPPTKLFIHYKVVWSLWFTTRQSVAHLYKFQIVCSQFRHIEALVPEGLGDSSLVLWSTFSNSCWCDWVQWFRMFYFLAHLRVIIQQFLY